MAIIKNDIIFDKKYNLATDIYFPADTNSATKILIFWHGGGWFHGDKKDVKNLGVMLANAGFMTFIPNYRLAPEYKFPAAHEDAKNFVDWLLKSEYTDEDDQNNIVQIGASVGGTLAIYVAGLFGFPTVTWSAPVEFSNFFKEHPDVKPSKDAKKEFGASSLEEIHESFFKYFTLAYTQDDSPEILKKLDAKSYDLSKLDKIMMINSAHELNPLDSVLDFIHFLAIHDHEVELLVIKGNRHAMSYAMDYLDESLDYLRQVIKRQG